MTGYSFYFTNKKQIEKKRMFFFFKNKKKNHKNKIKFTNDDKRS